MFKNNKEIELALNSNDKTEIMRAVKFCAEQHGIANLAEKLQCSRTTLYRTLESNPKLETVINLCIALDLKITINPKKKRGNDA